jgi:NADPH2 dehydrogenase
MGMEDPILQFTNLISKLDKLGLAYLYLIESRVSANAAMASNDSLDFAFDAFSGPILVAGGFVPELAKKVVDEERKHRDVAVVFGRYFLSTPDLVFRIQKGLELNEYDRKSFYMPKTEQRYTDDPLSQEFLAVQA